MTPGKKAALAVVGGAGLVALLWPKNAAAVSVMPSNYVIQPITEPQVMSKPAFTLYSIKQGETLSSIAARLYGDYRWWPELWSANRSTIQNPDLVLPGQVIRLPADMDQDNRESIFARAEAHRAWWVAGRPGPMPAVVMGA